MAKSRQELRNTPGPEKIKVRIALTVEVDVHDWCLTYGTHRDDVRDDVKTYIESAVREMNDAFDVIKVG
jgi:hypothetical protein